MTTITIRPLILTDGSRVHDVTVDQDGDAVTFNCINYVAAERMAFALRDTISSFTNETPDVEEADPRRQ